MTGAIRNYLLSVVAASMLSGILLSVTPNGAVRRTLSFLCGLVILLAALGPIARLDVEKLSQSMAGLRLETKRTAREAQSGNRELMEAIIKEQSEAYIWDKAAALGVSPSRVTVEVRTEGDWPVPCAAAIDASCTAAQRRRLSALIEQDLAIAPEEQEWVSDEKD